MTSTISKLAGAREKVELLRKTRPTNKPGSKFSPVEAIFEDGDAAARIAAHVDEVLMAKEAIKVLQEEIKVHTQTCMDTYGLNPKVFRVLVAAASTSVLDDLNDTLAAVERMYGSNQGDDGKIQTGVYQ